MQIERYLQNRTMRKNMMQEQGYLSDGYHTQEEAYGGTVYNPEQLPSNYGTGGSLVYNHQVQYSISLSHLYQIYSFP